MSDLVTRMIRKQHEDAARIAAAVNGPRFIPRLRCTPHQQPEPCILCRFQRARVQPTREPADG